MKAHNMKSYKDLLAENMRLKKDSTQLITVAVDLMNQCYHQAMRENKIGEERVGKIREAARVLIENKGE